MLKLINLPTVNVDAECLQYTFTCTQRLGKKKEYHVSTITPYKNKGSVSWHNFFLKYFVFAF